MERPKLRKIDIRFGNWNVRSLCRSRFLKTVPREIAKYLSSKRSYGLGVGGKSGFELWIGFN